MERLLVSQQGDTSGAPKQVYLRGTSEGALLVKSADPASADRELLVTQYRVKTAFAGASVGDQIRRVDVFDVSTPTATVVSVFWTNTSTNTDIAAPSNTNLEVSAQGDGLTQAQLIASGLATAANQVTAIGYLADLFDSNDKWAAYKFAESDAPDTGTKYILKSDGAGWLILKKTATATGSKTTFAGPRNNTGLSLTQAWGLRTTLVYNITIGGV